MSDKKFWEIADKYENLNSKGQSYVPKSNIKPLVEDILKANKGNINETKADLTLFNFKQHNVAQRIIKQILGG